MTRLTEQDLNRRLERLVVKRYARIAAQTTGIQGLGDCDTLGELDGFLSKIGKALKKVVQAPVKAIQQVTHAVNAAVVNVLPVSDKFKDKLESALNKPADIQVAVVKASTGDTGDLRAMIKHDVEESKKVLKVVLPIVSVVAQFFPGIGTVIGIAAGLANAALQISEKRSAAKKLKEQAAQVAAQDQALADEANAQAKLLEDQAAIYETAADYISKALQAGYITEGMTGQQIQDGVAKWSLAVRGINLTTGEAQALLNDSVVQATQQAAASLAASQAAAAQTAATVATATNTTPAVQPSTANNPLYTSTLFSSGGGSSQQPIQYADDSSATAPPVQTAGFSIAGSGGIVLALGVLGFLAATARPAPRTRYVSRGTKKAKRK